MSDVRDVIAGRRRWAMIEGDCVVDGRVIADGVVDSVIVDPPYGMSYQGWKNNREPILNDERPFIWFLPEAFRVLRDGGALLCFCPWRGQEDFRRAIELAGFRVMSQVIWDRVQHGMGNTSCMFGPRHDVIWFATKGRGFHFPAGRPVSVLQAVNVPARQRVHSTQKPRELMTSLVRAVTPAGGLVYDPCCGSGSTGDAAIRAGYRFIGAELDPANAGITRRRLREAVAESFRPRPKLAPQTHCFRSVEVVS